MDNTNESPWVSLRKRTQSWEARGWGEDGSN